MPLEAHCNCDAMGPKAMACGVSLRLLVSGACGTTLCEWQLRGDRGAGDEVIAAGDAAGSDAVVLEGVWADPVNFATIYMRYQQARSDFLFTSESGGISFVIELKYTCIDALTGDILDTWTYESRNPDGGTETCPMMHEFCLGGIGNTRGWGPGSAGGATICTTPLDGFGCDGFTINTAAGWQPPPLATDELEALGAYSPGNLVCATGGTPPYTFRSSSGYLAGGVTLNLDGTLTGTPNGQPGSAYLGLVVTDALGQTAEVVCLQAPCPACTQVGNAFY